MLIAEWPPRDPVPYPDPLEKIPFADADGVVSEELKTPTVITADIAKLGRASRFAACRGRASVTVAVDLQLTAEGVETPIAATTLLRHGCNPAQGFLLSHPVTGDAMESLLSTRRVPLPFSATENSSTPVT
jgi:hypothetical protein